MREKLLNLVDTGRGFLTTATLRQSGITFVGTIINGALGAVFYILSARALGPAGFGIMSVAISVAMLASSIGDLGTDTGLVRFVSYYLAKDKKKALRFLKLTFKTKVIAGVLITSGGYLLSDLIATYLFQKPELTSGIKIAFVAVFAMLVYGFVVSYLKALQRFFLWVVVQVGANFFRVVAILVLFVIGLISVEASLWIYTFTLIVGFVIGMIFLVPKDFLQVRNENSVVNELFHYNKWIASFTLVAAVSSRLDTFISARLLTPSDLGLYGAANQLVYIVPQIIGALGTVFAPKMAGMEPNKVVNYLKKAQLLVLGLAFLGLLAAPVVAFFVPVIFGDQYLGAIPPFYVLLVAMLIFLISVPVQNVILYFYSYPKLFFWLALMHLAIMGGLGWILISRFGIMGAAFTVLVGTSFNFIVPTIWLIRKIKK